jgi:hypothetical protein
VTSYCGCHNEPASTTTASSSLQCSLCGDGNPVLNPNAMVMNGTIACRQLQITASFVIDAAYCATLQTETNATCCTAPPTAAPTVAAAALSNETDSATTADDAAPTSNSNETESDGGDSSSRDVETPAPDDSSSSNNSTNLSPGGDTVSASTAGTARFSRRAFANVLVPAVVALMLVGTNLWG